MALWTFPFSFPWNLDSDVQNSQIYCINIEQTQQMKEEWATTNYDILGSKLDPKFSILLNLGFILGKLLS